MYGGCASRYFFPFSFSFNAVKAWVIRSDSGMSLCKANSLISFRRLSGIRTFKDTIRSFLGVVIVISTSYAIMRKVARLLACLHTSLQRDIIHSMSHLATLQVQLARFTPDGQPRYDVTRT